MLHSVLRRTLLLTASALLGLCFGEALLAALYWADPHDNLLVAEEFGSPFIFSGRPNTVVEEEGFEYRLNNLGMRRARDVSPAPPPGTYRILAYGDSITMGWRVDVEDTYPHRLEERLNETGDRPYQVLNMYRGVSPTVTSFHVRRDLRRLAADGVLLQIELLNDTSDEARVSTRGEDRDGLPLEIVRGRYLVGWDGRLLAPLAVSGSAMDRTKVWALASQMVGRMRSAVQVPLDRSKEPPWFDGSDTFFYHLGFDRYLLDEQSLAKGFERMFDSLAGIHRALDREAVRTLVVIIPSKFAYAHPRYRSAALEVLRRAERAASDRDLPFISLYHAFGESGGADLFMDFCHPNAAGNRVIARELEAVVSNW